jgi:hypothetical protein
MRRTSMTKATHDWHSANLVELTVKAEQCRQELHEVRDICVNLGFNRPRPKWQARILLRTALCDAFRDPFFWEVAPASAHTWL